LFSADFGKNTHYKILRKSSWRKLSCSLCMDGQSVNDGAHSAFSQLGERTKKSKEFSYFSLGLCELGGG
jgi:hypothetical protein